MPEYRFAKSMHPMLREQIRNGEGREIPDAVRQMVERLPGRFVRFQVRYTSWNRFSDKARYGRFEWCEQWLAGNEQADREAREWIDYAAGFRTQTGVFREPSCMKMSMKQFTNYLARSMGCKNAREARRVLARRGVVTLPDGERPEPEKPEAVPVVIPPPARRVGALA